MTGARGATPGPLRTAVIGVGHLGRHHARLLASVPGTTFVAAADLQRERAEAAVQGTGARAVTDAAALAGEVDAVVVAVPTDQHLAVARPFLEAGVHVLVEKPIASSLDEADELIRLAGRSGAVLAVGHTERFNPAVQAALPVLRTPRFVEVHRLSGFPERSLDIDVVFDVMIHDLDLMLAVDGTEVTAVEAIGVPVLTPRVDIANARLKFASGCVANITASRISRDKVRKVRFFQPDMYVSVDYGAQELEVWRLTPRPGGRPAIEGGPVEVAKDEPLRQELLDFTTAIRDGRPPRVDGAAGRRALALATRVALAIEDGLREAPPLE
ncbi:MAG: Gfo/Idh/MocA family oxidoreductase [Vicinamibacterales bacterium]